MARPARGDPRRPRARRLPRARRRRLARPPCLRGAGRRRRDVVHPVPASGAVAPTVALTRPSCDFPECGRPAVVGTALDEDLGGRAGVDVTTMATIPAEQVSSAQVVARADGVVAGMPLRRPGVRRGGRAARRGPRRRSTARAPDGDVVAAGRRRRRRCSGSHPGHLVGERTMLNLVCRLSGVATHTREWADAPRGHRRDGPRHPQDDARGCAPWRSTPSAPAAAPTSGWASTTSR